jgi:DNA processing protein
MNELTALVALSRLRGLSNIDRRGIVERHGEVAPIFRGEVRLDDRATREKVRAYRDFEAIERELERLERMKVRVLTIGDGDYPGMLRNIPDPPIVLYRKGSFIPPETTLAVVGTRNATFEDMHLAETVSATVSTLGITVVSGLARGIDTCAHRGALKGKGKTVAVIGSGMDICYPAENRALYAAVAEEGAIFSEYGLGEPPLRHHFPERNRIIAGLARAILVVEASMKSGALITARLGLDYGREVMAVPGSPFTEGHAGTNALIKDGARLVASADDIVSACFPGLTVPSEKQIDMGPDEAYIYRLVSLRKIHIDEIIETSGMEAKNVMAVLTRLVMKDALRELPGGHYIRT